MARRQKVDEEEHNYWMSYSDMMAALLLTFVLIIAFPVSTSTSSIEVVSWKSDTDKFLVAFSIAKTEQTFYN